MLLHDLQIRRRTRFFENIEEFDMGINIWVKFILLLNTPVSGKNFQLLVFYFYFCRSENWTHAFLRVRSCSFKTFNCLNMLNFTSFRGIQAIRFLPRRKSGLDHKRGNWGRSWPSLLIYLSNYNRCVMCQCGCGYVRLMKEKILRACWMNLVIQKRTMFGRIFNWLPHFLLVVTWCVSKGVLRPHSLKANPKVVLFLEGSCIPLSISILFMILNDRTHE